MNLRVRTVHALSAMVMVQCCCCCDGAAGREGRRAVLVFCERASPLALAPPYLPRPNPNLLPTYQSRSYLPTACLVPTYLSLTVYFLPTDLPAWLPPLVNFRMDGFTPMVGENQWLVHYQPMDFPLWPVQNFNHRMAIRLEFQSSGN
jgi:hypothetical protein